ncbi:MAG: hypothetical protein RMX65_032620 [Nostoc sp. DedQUE01]|nr:hypothetical protein [Nostoc sp. DedQUE01]
MGNSGVNLFDVFVGLFGDRDREKISYSAYLVPKRKPLEVDKIINADMIKSSQHHLPTIRTHAGNIYLDNVVM